MYFLENVRLALSALKANKLRSILTMLGIIIGICSVITITTIGNSLKDTFETAFNTMMGRSVYTTYDYEDEDPSKYRRLSEEDYVTSKMIDELEKRFDGKYLPALNYNIGTGSLKNAAEKELTVDVYGASEGYIKSNGPLYKMKYGRTPNIADNNGMKHTIAISTYFSDKYFGKGKNPLGEDIELFIDGVGKIHFTVIGVYELSDAFFRKASQSGGKKDEVITPVFIPYRTSTRLKTPPKNIDRFPEFYINEKRISSEKAVAEIQEFFDDKYKNADFWKPLIYDYSDYANETVMYINILTIVLAVIAAISLIVGGIGVMNIMMVSITERTREIGVRKAMGAKNRDIKFQFLIESAILCLVGGGIGILFGLLNGVIVETVGNMLIKSNPEYGALVTIDIRVSVTAIIAALAFSMVIGLFFGIYPAGKAAKLDPIEALRYE